MSWREEMRLFWLFGIPAWPCRIQLLFCFVWVEVVGPSAPANESRNDLSSYLLQVNQTGNYQIGHGNNLFGERTAHAIQPHRTKRRKRSVVHLYNMVNCATGCDPLLYKGYGCYCGFLGSGYAVDGIDRCCQMHDWCYDSSGCPMFLEYFVPYLWKCYHGQPLCGVDYGPHGSCGRRLCHCDQLLAQCLRNYPCPTTKALCVSSPWRLLQNVLMF